MWPSLFPELLEIYLTITAVIGLSTWMGYRLLGVLRLGISTTHLVGLGVLSGGVLTSLMALALTSFGVANEFSLVGVGIITTAATFVSKSRAGESVSHETMKLDGRVLIQAVGLGLIGFNTFSIWSTALGLVILMLPWAGVIELKSQQFRRAYSTSLVIIAAAVVLQLFTYQTDWWYAQSNDVPFFESLSWSLARYGENSHPGLLGGSIDGYHYLGYLWVGTISDIAAAPPFHVINVIMPFLEVFSISLVLLSPHKNYQASSKSSKSRTLLVLALILGIRYTSFTSFTLANWSLICYLALLFSVARPAPKSRSANIFRFQVVLGIFGIVAVLGKGTSLPVVLALGLATGLVDFCSNFKMNSLSTMRHLPFHLLAVSGVAWWWYNQTAQSLTFTSDEPSPWSNSLNMGLNEGLWLSRDVFQLLPTFIGLGAFVLLRSRKQANTLDHTDFLSIALFSLLVTGTLLVMPVVNARYYTQNHALVVLLACAVVIPKRDGLRLTAQILVPILLVASVASWIDIFYLPEFMIRLWSSAPTRWIPLAVYVAWLPVTLLLSTLIIRVVLNRYGKSCQWAPDLRSWSSTWLLVTLTLSVAVWNQINRLEQFPQMLASNSTLNSDVFTAAHPDASTTTLGNWVRKNLPAESVLASNSFCCAGITWLPEAVTQIRSVNDSFEDSKNSEVAFGGANYLLPAVTQRNFLLAGPRFIVGGNSNPETIARYLEISVMFGATGDPAFAAELRNAGVNNFVVDRLAMVSGKEPTFAEKVLFENERFLVLDLSLM